MRGTISSKSTGVTTLEHIDKRTVLEFEDEVHDRGLSPKQQQHIFGGARRLIRFAKKRSIEDNVSNRLTMIDGYMVDMQPNGTVKATDPKPISVADFRLLLDHAEGDDIAMLLTMMNGAMYAKECVYLKWSDFRDGCLVTNRAKTGESFASPCCGRKRLKHWQP